jgi:hypothetical protein
MRFLRVAEGFDFVCLRRAPAQPQRFPKVSGLFD